MTAVMMDLSSEALAQGLHIKVKDYLSTGYDSHKLNEYIQSLETERRKIEAFRRELPLCMQLISDVIRAVKEHQNQQVQCTASSSALKLSCNSEEDDGSYDQSPSNSELKRKLETSDDNTETKKRKCLDIDLEKPHWMAEAQLWDHENTKKKASAGTVRPQAKHAVPGTFGLGGGAFSPFVRITTEKSSNSDLDATTNTAAATPAATTASAPPSQHKQEQAEQQRSEPLQPKSNSSSSGGGQRKSRRCWSPELHHRFVAALQQLGGAHAATPKQIREIMKVDGLTSDEVKSHLQKYRLHTRRPSVSPAGAGAGGGSQPTQLVVLGGIWVPPEFARQHNSSAGSSPAAGGFVSPFTQEFYSRMSAAAAAAAASPTPALANNQSSSKPKMSVEPKQAQSSEGESLEAGEQEGQSRHEDRDQEED